MNNVGWILFELLSLALVIAILVQRRGLDLKRIRENVESHGGTVVRIAPNRLGAGWFGRGDRSYDVTYHTRHGQIRTATCKTSRWDGVFWADPPLGLSPSNPEPNAPLEPITCLSCGTQIPATQTRCLKCGWSYKGV